MIESFRMDLQRWNVPERPLTIGLVVRLLLRYMQLRMMLLIRFGIWCNRKHIRGLPSIVQRMISLFYGLEITFSQEIGGGLYIPHPYGMVLMPESIGKNCSIIHNVTIGMRTKREFPIIEDDVFIGAGACILGGIRLGRGSRIGANAVVIDDVPPCATVVGVPARVIHIGIEV